MKKAPSTDGAAEKNIPCTLKISPNGKKNETVSQKCKHYPKIYNKTYNARFASIL